MEILSENSDTKQALRADSASFRTILNRDTTSTGRHINAAVGAADSNVWALT